MINNKYQNKQIWNKFQEMYDPKCAKLAGIVATGIHLYSQVINDEHFQGIYEDFANGDYIKGTLKATVPIILPYCVSFYSRKKAKKEAQEKINNLEQIIERLNENQNLKI